MSIIYLWISKIKEHDSWKGRHYQEYTLLTIFISFIPKNDLVILGSLNMLWDDF
jgi:hypothetical protein